MVRGRVESKSERHQRRVGGEGSKQADSLSHTRFASAQERQRILRISGGGEVEEQEEMNTHTHELKK